MQDVLACSLTSESQQPEDLGKKNKKQTGKLALLLHAFLRLEVSQVTGKGWTFLPESSAGFSQSITPEPFVISLRPKTSAQLIPDPI